MLHLLVQFFLKRPTRRRKGASPRQSGRDPAGAKAFQFEDVIHPGVNEAISKEDPELVNCNMSSCQVKVSRAFVCNTIT